MARVKHIDKNPEFTFEFSTDVEDNVRKLFERLDITMDVLDGSKDILPNGDIRLEFTVSDSYKANLFSYGLSEFRKNFYGLYNLNNN